MKNIFYILISLSALILLNSCGDDIPTDYVEEVYVEGYMLVGEPIRNIVVAKTQPVTVKYNQENALYRDAQVVIKGDGREFPLKIESSGVTGFYAEDQDYLVKAKTEYTLEISTPDGKFITGFTTTPETIEWVSDMPKPLQFPKDSLNPSNSDPIEWTKAEGVDYYLISVKALDTLEYGKYLDDVPDSELNRRIERPWTDDDGYFYDTSMWAFIANTKTSIVWAIFKWFGDQETTVFAPDSNYRKWFQQQWTGSRYDENLSSIKGGIGVFGSASLIRDTTFLIKNQP